MINFNKNKIMLGSDIISNELKNTRLYKKIKIKDMAKDLNISSRYLEALENNRFDKLPTGVYGKNFLREYALYLNLDAEKLISLYNDEISQKQNRNQKNLFTQKITGAHYFLAIPKIIKNSLIIICVLFCSAYITFCVKKIIKAPTLSVMTPTDNLITSEHSINIKGTTEPEADISINGELVLKDNSGSFEKKINLKNGMNIISVSAQKKYSRQNNITKKILVKS